MFKNLVSKAKFPGFKSHLLSLLADAHRHQFSFFKMKVNKNTQFIGHYYRCIEMYFSLSSCFFFPFRRILKMLHNSLLFLPCKVQKILTTGPWKVKEIIWSNLVCTLALGKNDTVNSMDSLFSHFLC